MRIQAFSIVVGGKGCNARCPFCVSRMTGTEMVSGIHDSSIICHRHLVKAVKFAKMGNVSTVLLTGKGEPTLYPYQLTSFIQAIGREFPFIELQTNGLELGRLASARGSRLSLEKLGEWGRSGLNTIAISAVSLCSAENSQVYTESYPDLQKTVDYLHQYGFTVRICIMLRRGCIDRPEKLLDVIHQSKEWGIDQLTVRPLRIPNTSGDTSAERDVLANGLTEEEIVNVVEVVRREGTPLLKLMHGAQVYDFSGQNICLSDCLTDNGEGEEDVRTLILYPNGELRYDWQYRGAVLLGPEEKK